MTLGYRKPIATRPLQRRAGLVAYVACGVAASFGLALAAAEQVSPVLLAIGLATYLAVAALVFFLFESSRHLFTYARWRDVMPCHLSVQDEDLRIIDNNDHFRRDFGDRRGEYCYRVYKNNDRPCPECPVVRTFQDGQVHTSEETVITKDGAEEYVVVTSAPLLDDSGKVRAVVEMATNITELKHLQDLLERTQRNYRRLFDQVPCYISVVDRELRVVQSNALYRRDFGEGLNAHCYKLCKNRSKPCSDCLLVESFKDGKVHSREETLTTRDHRKIAVVVYTMPVRNEEGEITSVVEMFTDITEVKRLQRQLTLIGRAVAGMAHRVKNILMGLEGGIFVVNTGMEEDDKAQLAEGWEMIERNMKRVSNVVKDLLYCAKERQPQFQDDVCPHEIMKEVHSMYSKRTAEEAITLRLEDGNSCHRGTFDREGLHSLLCNLVANAIDGCRFDPDQNKPTHTITMRCQQNDRGATVLEVEDDGVGIPEELGQKVFEDFFSTKGTEGTGIGLLVVQKIAEEHGGSVKFTTTPGQGTTFRVALPPVVPEKQQVGS